MTEYISYAWEHATEHASAVQEETENIANYLENQPLDNGENFVADEFGHYDLGSYDDEYDFIEKMLDVIHYSSSSRELFYGETVVFPHHHLDWGYGINHSHTLDGITVNGALVYAGTEIPKIESRIMTWHEVGHTPISTSDSHSQATATCCNGSSQLDNITPMAASYTRDSKGFAYMKWEGQADSEFDEFCNGTDNYEGTSCWGCHTNGVFDFRYSQCTLDQVDKWLKYYADDS